MDNAKISQKTSAYLQKEKALELLGQEIAQLEQEGKDIGDEIKETFAWLKKEGTPGEIEEFYNSLESLDQRSDYPYEEPSEIEEIRNKTRKVEITLPKILGKDVLYDRIQGAWLG